MSAAATPRFTDSRPKIFLDGNEDASLKQGLLSMTIEEDVRGLYHAEFRFGNFNASPPTNGFIYFDRKILDFGKKLEVKLGSDSIFEGRISGLEGCFPEGGQFAIAALVEDRMQDLRMTRRTRSFEDVSDSDLFNQIAREHGLTAQVDAQGPTYKSVAQVNQSNLAFLRERARAIDAELWVEGTKLQVKKRSARNGGSSDLGFGNELYEFTVLADLAGQRTSVTVNGWDVPGKSAIQYAADSSTVQGELGNDDGGASILQQAFGERKESVDHIVPLTTAEARAVAEGAYRTLARKFVVGKGRALTSSKLRVGNFVNLSGLGPLFNGKYYLSRVRHAFDGARGLQSEFTAERPGIGKAN
jgi:Bacteriophage probable baseplate hub protein